MKTLITAHAGALNTKANVMASIEKLMEAAADIIEVDVRLTRDQVLVLNHDPSVRIKDRLLMIDYTPFSVLKEGQEDLVTLEAVFKKVKGSGIKLNLDLKTKWAIIPLIVLIKRCGMLDQVVCSGCSHSMVFELKKKLPKLQVLLNVEEELKNQTTKDYKKAVQKLCEEVSVLKSDGLNVNYEDCNKHLLTYTKKQGIPVCVWTVDDQKSMEQMLAYGVASITTNEVELLKEALVVRA